MARLNASAVLLELMSKTCLLIIMFAVTALVGFGSGPSTQEARPRAEPSQATVARPPLTFGSPMPLPEIAQWARGEAPDFSDKSKTFLLSFWSSSITPARESLTQLSKFADHYRDQGLVVVGVTEEPMAGIQPLLDSPKFREGVRFAIGCDPDRSTYRQFMTESWQVALPTAFLAQNGQIIWIGSPRDAGEVLESVFAGKWTPQGRRAAHEEAAAAMKRATDFEARIEILIDRREWDALLLVLDEMEKDPNASLAREGKLLRVSTLQQAGKTDEALRLCDSLVKSTRDWEVASEVAKMLVSQLFPRPDLGRATMAALRAIALSKKHQARAYCAMADVQFRGGQKDLAIQSLERALLLADSDEISIISERLAESRPPSNQKPADSPSP